MLKRLVLTKIMACILFIVFTIWGIYLSQVNDNQIDPTFSPMYQQFLTEAKKRSVNLDKKKIVIKFDSNFFNNINKEVGATCQYFPRPTILVNEKIWKEEPIFSQELILFHELAHCLMYSTHSVGNELHVMNEEFSLELWKAYLKNRTFYLDDLFYHPNHEPSDYWKSFKSGIIENLDHNPYFKFLWGVLFFFICCYLVSAYRRKKI